MSAVQVYHRVKKLFRTAMNKDEVDESTQGRLSLLVTGMLKAKHSSPAQVAKALGQMRLTEAKAESLERQIRRLENDPELRVETVFHPFVRQHLAYGRPKELILIMDATTQEDRVVMLSVSIWFRGRALPLVWAIWSGNVLLEGEGFWQRAERLLDELAPLLLENIPVTMLADCAFGCPVFTDMVLKHGWHYIVRVQNQTVCQDRLGRERPVGSLVPYPGRRVKMCGRVFKKHGWRPASIVAYWGKRHDRPLLLVSDLKLGWKLLALYRQRYPIEARFRDDKSSGWRWEQGQVTDLEHVQRLLIAMALASWIVLMVGCWCAQNILQRPPTGKRSTRPWEGKMSLFQHGLNSLQEWLGGIELPGFWWRLTDWSAPNWETHILNHHLHAFIFA